MAKNGNPSTGNLAERTLAILEYVSRARGSVSILDIANSLDLPTTTVHRILQTIKEAGYLRQTENKEYISTFKLLELASNITGNDPLVNTLYPFMCYFAARYGCQVGLSAFFGTASIIHLTTVGSAARFNDRYTLPGSVLPAYCTAAGKVFLSQLTDRELDRWLATNSLIPRTANTIISTEELRTQIEITRDRGYGVVVSELYNDIACVSIPIVGKNLTVLGTMNFTTTPEEFGKVNNPEFIEEVRSTLAKISI